MTIQNEAPTPTIFSTSFITKLVVGVLLINLFVAALVGLSLRQSWLQYQKRAELTAQNLAQVLAEEIDSDFERIDLALHTVVSEVEEQIAAGGINSPSLNGFLMQMQAHLPEVISIRATDAHGIVLYGNDLASGSRASVADREYFTLQRDNPRAGLVINKPVQARIDPQWAIPISRRFNLPDGSFGGVAYVNFAIEHLATTVSTIDVGRRGAIAVIDGELNIVARYPEFQSGNTVGKQLPSNQLKELVQAKRNMGTYHTRNTVDGIERTFSFRRIVDTPFYILVGLSSDDYLAEWRSEATRMLALLIFFSMTTALLSWLIYRAWTRHLIQERILAQQSRLAAMGDMINNIAHQWRQPLNVLGMLIQNIQIDNSNGAIQKEALDRDAEEMMAQVREMTKTIDDFRDFFKPNKIKQDFSLLEAIKNTLILVGKTLKIHCIDVRVEEGEEVVVNGHPNELAQVLINVINNAKDAMLEKTMASGQIDISIGHDGKNGWVTIKDDAGGIPETIFSKIFDHYFSTKETGTGIGLSMSRDIMNRMDGEIRARNIEGGAEFTTYLPLAKH